jgi:hypothetical protein
LNGSPPTRVLTKRTVDPQPTFTDSMHHWRSGLPPLRYVKVQALLHGQHLEGNVPGRSA